jgi:hypothetical protein
VAACFAATEAPAAPSLDISHDEIQRPRSPTDLSPLVHGLQDSLETEHDFIDGRGLVFRSLLRWLSPAKTPLTHAANPRPARRFRPLLSGCGIGSAPGITGEVLTLWGCHTRRSRRKYRWAGIPVDNRGRDIILSSSSEVDEVAKHNTNALSRRFRCHFSEALATPRFQIETGNRAPAWALCSWTRLRIHGM